MTDSEYLKRMFEKDSADKKRTGRGLQKMNRTGKGGVKMPSDYLTKKEKKKLNSTVVSYKLNKVLTYAEFKRMPEDLQRQYILNLQDRFNIGNQELEQLWAVSHGTISNIRKRLELPAPSARKLSKDRAKGWSAWLADENIAPVVIAPKPEEEDEYVEPDPVEEEPVGKLGVLFGLGENSKDEREALLRLYDAVHTMGGKLHVTIELDC